MPYVRTNTSPLHRVGGGAKNCLSVRTDGVSHPLSRERDNTNLTNPVQLSSLLDFALRTFANKQSRGLL